MKIWTTYDILAQIADKELEPDKAAEYRRLAREAKHNFAGTAHEMKQHAELITAVVSVCQGNSELGELVNAYLEAMKKGGEEWGQCSRSIEQILSGERDAEALCSGLGATSSIIIETILEALEDPSVLQDLLPDESSSE